MRDGVGLSTDVYLPQSGGPFPVLLLRTIYDNQADRGFAFVPRFVKAGYAVVMQDCRGRFDSDGDWAPYVNEASDGYDTQEWIGIQTWCDGTIGMFGSSYIGFTQTQTAPLRSRYLKALVPSASQEDNYGHWYVDGALQFHTAINFINMAGRTMQRGARELIDSKELYDRLPLISAIDDIVEIPFYREAIIHSTFDSHWRAYSMKDRYEQVETPAFFLTGWYDNLLHETFKLFHGWNTRGRTEETRKLTKILVGPWDHGNIYDNETVGPLEFGESSKLDIVKEHLRWYDQRLRGLDNGLDEESPIRIFVMGDNVWRYEQEWPLARTHYAHLYLHSDGKANSLGGDGLLSLQAPDDEPPDRYTYDPNDPVPTTGGQSMGIPLIEAGPRDRRIVERRDDVLVYTSEPVETELEVTGPITLILYAASSAVDTDFTGTLVDVFPTGEAIIICEGIIRARMRESLTNPVFMEPGEIYKFCIDLWETSNVFKAGHQIRVEVSSSNFPRYDRNLNNDREPGMNDEMRLAHQIIYHDRQYPSHITLPTIPR